MSLTSINDVADDDINVLVHAHRYASAFEVLVDRYHKKVFHLTCSILNDSGRAEEVAQDVFLKVWQVLPDYDGRASLSTWLYAIARNTALSALRSECYRKTVPLEEEHEPQGAAARSGLWLELEQLLDRLPEPESQVIRLFYWQDRSVEDVATMLNIPEGTVKSHLHRARRRLAEWMRSSQP